MTMAALLRQRVENRPASTFGNALDALRFLRERAIKDDCRDRFMDMLDALDTIDGYIYDRATATEIHERLRHTEDQP